MVVAKIGGIPGCPSAPLLLPQSGGCGRLVLGVLPDALYSYFAAAHRQLREIGGKDIPDTPCFFQSYQSLIVRTPLSALVMLVGAELHSQPFRHLPLLDFSVLNSRNLSLNCITNYLLLQEGRPVGITTNTAGPAQENGFHAPGSLTPPISPAAGAADPRIWQGSCCPGPWSA